MNTTSIAWSETHRAWILQDEGVTFPRWYRVTFYPREGVWQICEYDTHGYLTLLFDHDETYFAFTNNGKTRD